MSQMGNPQPDNLKNIRAVLFDFDGVLVESTHIKTHAFSELFSTYTDNTEPVVSYHLRHGGISRYEKFRWIFSNILNRPVSENELQDLGEKFSKIVKNKVIQAPYVPGTLELLEFLHGRLLAFIASGTPQDELREIVQEKGITHYFSGVFGTPATKQDIIRKIMNAYELRSDHCVFIGDSLTDYQAARDHNLWFIARVSEENASLWPEDVTYRVNDMVEVKQLLAKVI